MILKGKGAGRAPRAPEFASETYHGLLTLIVGARSSKNSRSSDGDGAIGISSTLGVNKMKRYQVWFKRDLQHLFT